MEHPARVLVIFADTPSPSLLRTPTDGRGGVQQVGRDDSVSGCSWVQLDSDSGKCQCGFLENTAPLRVNESFDLVEPQRSMAAVTMQEDICMHHDTRTPARVVHDSSPQPRRRGRPAGPACSPLMSRPGPAQAPTPARAARSQLGPDAAVREMSGAAAAAAAAPECLSAYAFSFASRVIWCEKKVRVELLIAFSRGM